MLKESIICIAILTSIFIGNYCTQNYTKTSVTELSNMLDNLEEVVEDLNKANLLLNPIHEKYDYSKLPKDNNSK